MAPPPTGPPRTSGPNPLSVVSLTAGILGILGSFGCVVFGIPLGIVAVATGIIGLSQSRGQQGENRTLAIAGLGCGAVAIVLPLVFLLLPFAFGLY